MSEVTGGMTIDKALKGLIVVECGHFISGPYCSKLLADLGAEVIKVEPPVSGDESRSYGPFVNDHPDREQSGLFIWLNASKKSVTLNLHQKEDKEKFRELIKQADVLIENSQPGIGNKHALAYRTMKRLNPQLVQVSITPFGRSGPYKDYKAYHINLCAAGGVSIGIGSPDREPLVMPLYQAYFQAGIAAASAILMALIARRKGWGGQLIDISEAEVLATLHTGRHLLTYLYRGELGGYRRGNQAEYFLYPNGVLPCRDGYMGLVAPQVAQWLKFVEMMGNPPWTKEPRYRDRRAMHADYPEEVDNLLIPWLKQYTREEIFQKCLEKHVPPRQNGKIYAW